MRFAFIINNYPPKNGGVENHVFALATRLLNMGHQVRIYTLDAAANTSDEQGIEIVRMRETSQIGGVLGLPYPGTMRSVAKDLRERPVDIISVHTRFFPMTIIGSKIGRKLGIPVIHTEHGSGHVTSPSLLIRQASKAVDKTLGKAALRRADAVLGVSEDVVAFAEKLAGVSGRVFYNAIELSSEPPKSEIKPNHLVFVGRIAPGKGWDTLLSVVEKLRGEGREVTAEFLGDGPDLPQLRQMAELSKAREAITIRGRVSSEQVRVALAGSTLVNPTVLSEGFQTTLLEALAEGGRVVTYPVPGAEKLRAQGASVVVTTDRSEDSLIEALRESLGEPWSAFTGGQLAQWCWEVRAAQYVDIAKGLTR